MAVGPGAEPGEPMRSRRTGPGTRTEPPTLRTRGPRHPLAGICALAAFAVAIPFWSCSGSGQEASRARPSIVLCVLDTVRRDATGLGDPGETRRTAPGWPAMAGGLTPNLDRLAEDSAVFTQAFSAAPWTVPAHASMFTGLLPNAHRSVARSPRLGSVGPTLAELAAGAGYETAAFYSNPWLSTRATGLLRGFEVQEEAPIGGLGSLTNQEGDQGGAQTLRNLNAWLTERRRDKPFLVFVNLLEAHLPYAPPPAIRQQASPPLPPGAVTSIQWAHEFNSGLHPSDAVDWDLVQGLYAADVRHADELFGRLLGILREHGVYEDSVLLVTSDHGENLGDHGLMEHQFSLHETLLAVPLLARLPGAELPSGRYRQPVMTTDLYATVAELAGAEWPAEGRLSVPLMRTVRDEGSALLRPVFADYANPHSQLLALLASLNPGRDFSPLDQTLRSVRRGPLRLTAGSNGALVLHDMVEDPRQTTDVAAARRDAVDELRSLLMRARSSLPIPAAPTGGMDEETRKRLEALGYATGDGEDQ